MRRTAFVTLMALAVMAEPVRAQDQTLADIRQELSVLFVEVQRLTRELSTTGGSMINVGGDTIQRVDQIEAALGRLTSKTEELEFRINQIVSDGTNRIGDLEFRLCELESGCDIGSLGDTPRLGGDTGGVTSTIIAQPADDGTQLAIGERVDFDTARSALDAGDFRRSADLFETFTETYPGGPLSTEAHYLRGEALAGLDDTPGAARAFLASFSGDPNGSRAPDALLALGVSLGVLGQRTEACVTLGEVPARFPGSEQALEAQQEKLSIGCS
jgi:tol-pal system protein YbgF